MNTSKHQKLKKLKLMETTELLNLQTSVDSPDNVNSNLNEDVTAYVTVEDSPFTLVKIGEKWEIVLGNYKVSTAKFDETKDAIKYIKSKPWELILTTIASYLELINEIKQQNETTL